MSTWTRVRGDVNDTVVVQLNGADNLNGVIDAKAYVRYGNRSDELAATVLDSTARTVTVDLSPWLETAAAGQWDIEYQLTFGDGRVRTWPESRTDKIIVRDELG